VCMHDRMMIDEDLSGPGSRPLFFYKEFELDRRYA